MKKGFKFKVTFTVEADDFRGVDGKEAARDTLRAALARVDWDEALEPFVDFVDYRVNLGKELD